MSVQIILVSDKPDEIQKVGDFSRKNCYVFSVYTPEEWNSRSDEVFLFHNEESSLKVISLPSGHRPVFSLEEVEAYIIEKVLSLCDGNTSKAARLLRIGRATLYRKIEKLGLELKHIRCLSAIQKTRKSPVYRIHKLNGKKPLKKAS